VSPLQLRPTYIGEAQKAYQYRVTGLKEKFVEAGDITYFANEFERHLKTTGMDTIAYLKDPEMSEMVSVVSKHTRFTVDSATALTRAQAKKYDDNDRDNDTAATVCLLDSVSPNLKKRIRNRIADTDPFPIDWIEFVTLVLSTSIDRYEKLKQRIQGRHPSQYAGQDMVKLVEDFSTDAKALTMAGHYDHSLTLSMLQIFLKAGGDGSAGEAFRFPIRTLKMRLDAALLAIALKEKGPAQAFMAKEALLFTDICKCVENEYRKLKDANEWTPAKHAQDSKAVTAQFGAYSAAGSYTSDRDPDHGDDPEWFCHGCQAGKVQSLSEARPLETRVSGFAA
jgi:hypothetical protein